MENEARFFRGVPEFFDVAEGRGGELDLERFFCGFLEDGGEGGEDFLDRDAAESAAEEFEAGAAERGGVEGDGRAGPIADLEVAETTGCVIETFLHDGGEQGLGGCAPEVVEYYVDALAISVRKAAVRAS